MNTCFICGGEVRSTQVLGIPGALWRECSVCHRDWIDRLPDDGAHGYPPPPVFRSRREEETERLLAVATELTDLVSAHTKRVKTT
jgi:hypothetical protein